MNGQVEVTWRTLRTIAHSLMVQASVPENYIHFDLMYTTDHIFLVLPIKDLINEDGDPTTLYKLATGTKPSVSHLHVLFCPCVVRKATANVDTKTLNMRHQAQNKTRKCDTEGFVPVANLYGVVGYPSSFIRYFIGSTGNI